MEIIQNQSATEQHHAAKCFHSVGPAQATLTFEREFTGAQIHQALIKISPQGTRAFAAESLANVETRGDAPRRPDERAMLLVSSYTPHDDVIVALNAQDYFLKLDARYTEVTLLSADLRGEKDAVDVDAAAQGVEAVGRVGNKLAEVLRELFS